MAVDTRDKRAAALNAFQPSFWIFPDPDGSLDNAVDRLHAGHVYNVELGTAATAGFICVQDAYLSLPSSNSAYICMPRVVVGHVSIPRSRGTARCY